VIDEDAKRIESWVPDTNKPAVAGNRPARAERASRSQLTGWDIDILTEQEESERRQADSRFHAVFMNR